MVLVPRGATAGVAFSTTCSAISDWSTAIRPARRRGSWRVNVAINLSARQTRDPHLREDIRNALQEHGMQAGQLSREMTESVLMENIESNISMLKQLRADGILLTIDDFGAGYSSMADLKRFHMDELKIDRAFIRDIPGDGEDEAIVTAVVALAHSLGLSVVAEGVETEEQHAFLRSVHCDSAQGYHFSRPVPFAAATVFLQRSATNTGDSAYAKAG
jgi:EAL domain-containing protein (putative c-di-GMP-specific phosphodiesterase class I)